jgi:hypothetical protein
MTTIRHHITPGDAPADVAARRMGLTPAQFKDALPDLRKRGFPAADPTTGLYDLDAIDAWRKKRHPHLYQAAEGSALHAKSVVSHRMSQLANGQI